MPTDHANSCPGSAVATRPPSTRTTWPARSWNRSRRTPPMRPCAPWCGRRSRDPPAPWPTVPPTPWTRWSATAAPATSTSEPPRPGSTTPWDTSRRGWPGCWGSGSPPPSVAARPGRRAPGVPTPTPTPARTPGWWSRCVPAPSGWLGGATPYPYGVQQRALLGDGRQVTAGDIGRAVRLHDRVQLAAAGLMITGLLLAGSAAAGSGPDGAGPPERRPSARWAARGRPVRRDG